MNLNVSIIPASGITIALTLAEEWVVNAIKTAVNSECVQIDGDLVVNKYDARITVDISISLTIIQNCSRCVVPLHVKLAGHEHLTYEPEVINTSPEITNIKQLEKIKEEIELHEDDMDIGWYSNGKLCVEDVLSETITLITPSRFHCDMKNTTRTKKGKCVKYKGDDEPLTYNPFANLDEL